MSAAQAGEREDKGEYEEYEEEKTGGGHKYVDANGRPAADAAAVDANGRPAAAAAATADIALIAGASANFTSSPPKARQRNRRKNEAEVEEDEAAKRRCVSTACIACRKRKSKCDGNIPACAACSQVYGTTCVYDPNSDHRRKGVYKNGTDHLRTRASTLEAVVQAILDCPEDEVSALVQEMRTCGSVDAVASRIVAKYNGMEQNGEAGGVDPDVGPRRGSESRFKSHLHDNMGQLRLDEGSVHYIGGTSNLIHLVQHGQNTPQMDDYLQQENPITSWTTVTEDPDLVLHLLNMYFTWHYTFFTTLSKRLFYRDFALGKPPVTNGRTRHYCTSLLVNAMLALGCHFTSRAGSRSDSADSATAGDHFFLQAKRLLLENDEHEKPHLATVQALALMSVREAGCGREAKGWVYSGMSFRMACDMGLHLNLSQWTSNHNVRGDESEEDVRLITFWGCYLFDKCWSNYLGRLPQLPSSIVTVSKFDVFPDEDSAQWSPYTDSGFTQSHAQPARTRTVALQILKLCDISNDLMEYFYNPTEMAKTQSKPAELRKLSDIHTRLEAWRRDLPKELEPKEGSLSAVLIMHMFFQLLFLHLFRPFLKYNKATSPLPDSVRLRKLCTQAAAMISKLMRLYKRSFGLRQIPNIAVYITHSACTIHLLNLPDKNASRDITHGVKHLEEIADGWLCARRTLVILSVLAQKWKVELPDAAATVFARTDLKFGPYFWDNTSLSVQRPGPIDSLSPTDQALQQQPTTSHSDASQTIPNQPYATRDASDIQTASMSLGSPTQSECASDQAPSRDSKRSLLQPHPSAVNAHTTMASLGSQNDDGQPRADSSCGNMLYSLEQSIWQHSSDWAYRDQAQLAAGFEHWNETDIYPTAWNTSGVMPTINMSMPVDHGPMEPATDEISPASTVDLPVSGHEQEHVNLNGGSGGGYVPLNGRLMDPIEMASWLNSVDAHNLLPSSFHQGDW